MVEDAILIKLPPTSMLDIQTVFESLVCCLEGIQGYPYTITPAKLATDLDLGIQVHLWSGKDVIMS